MKEVNIIMTTYNGKKYVEEQIESILKNTYQDFLLTICDDGSTDGTIEVLQKYQTEYPEQIQVIINEQNKGVVQNFLEAVKVSESNYIMFCDQDDVWLEKKIEKTICMIQKYEKKYSKELPVAVFSDAVVVDSELQTIKESFYRASKLNPRKLELNYLLMENKLLGCSIGFNRALKEKIREVPQAARMHDWWVALIAISFGKIGFIKEPLLLYRQHEKNVVGNQSFYRYVANRIKNIKKQNEVLCKTIEQGREFYSFYQEELPANEKIIIGQFTKLLNHSFMKKRVILHRYRYYKSGIIRNIGLYFLI